jgi:hypothetical protein
MKTRRRPLFDLKKHRWVPEEAATEVVVGELSITEIARGYTSCSGAVETSEANSTG